MSADEQTSPRPTSRKELAARLEREADCEAPPSNEWWNGQIEALLREAAEALRDAEDSYTVENFQRTHAYR